MALQLSELVNATETAVVEIAGEPVQITFYRHSSGQMRAEALKEGRITREEFEELSRADAGDVLTFPFATSLAVRLKGWDLMVLAHGEETSPPVTSAFLGGLKDKHFMPLWHAVFGGMDDVPTDAPS